MTEKLYDENGFDQDGYDREGYNAFGELDPSLDSSNMEKEDIRQVARSKHGRALLWRILGFCDIFSDFEPGAREEDLRESIGRRRVGHYIRGILDDTDPGILLDIMNENYIKGKERDNAKRIYGKL